MQDETHEEKTTDLSIPLADRLLQAIDELERLQKLSNDPKSLILATRRVTRLKCEVYRQIEAQMGK